VGVVQSPETIARAILRSVEHPAPEVNTFPPMRIAYVLAEAFPSLAGFVARGYYAWSSRRLGLDRGRLTNDRAAATTEGTD